MDTLDSTAHSQNCTHFQVVVRQDIVAMNQWNMTLIGIKKIEYKIKRNVFLFSFTFLFIFTLSFDRIKGIVITEDHKIRDRLFSVK